MQKPNLYAWFDTCHEEYGDAIFRFCLAKTSRREVALDMTQEVFMRLWDEARGGKHIAHPRALAYTIARNLIIDFYRKKKTDSLDTLIEGGLEFGESASAETKSAYQEALEAINSLPEQYREAVYLRYVEELPPREIANIIGESVNVISVRITRGMRALRSRLEGI